jgi:hypothetical protein
MRALILLVFFVFVVGSLTTGVFVVERGITAAGVFPRDSHISLVKSSRLHPGQSYRYFVKLRNTTSDRVITLRRLAFPGALPKSVSLNSVTIAPDGPTFRQSVAKVSKAPAPISTHPLRGYRLPPSTTVFAIVDVSASEDGTYVIGPAEVDGSVPGPLGRSVSVSGHFSHYALMCVHVPDTECGRVYSRVRSSLTS